MYIEDLSKFNYDMEGEFGNQLSVGWLSKDHEFKKGDIPNKEKFLKCLDNYYKHTVSQTKGSHNCEFCNKSSGSNEIRVVGKDGKVYASPSLIKHYIKDHDYLPIQDFIDAVLSGPCPDSKEYADIVKDEMNKSAIEQMHSTGHKLKNPKHIEYLKSIGKITENKIMNFSEFKNLNS